MGAIHAGPGPVELAGCIELGDQDAVELVEDAGLLPPLQSPPARLSGAEPQLQREQLPGEVVAEHVQEPLQAQPVPAPAAAPVTAPAKAKSERDPSATPTRIDPGGLARQVVALGEVGCLLGRLGVQPCRRRQVAVALVEVRSHRGVAGQ